MWRGVTQIHRGESTLNVSPLSRWGSEALAFGRLPDKARRDGDFSSALLRRMEWLADWMSVRLRFVLCLARSLSALCNGMNACRDCCWTTFGATVLLQSLSICFVQWKGIRLGQVIVAWPTLTITMHVWMGRKCIHERT